LAGASLFGRLLGGLARIPLTRFLGGEGMGLFQMAYVIYVAAITFAISGLNVATSRLVAEWLARGSPREAARVFRSALVLGLVTGVGFWLVVDRGALYLATAVLRDGRAAAVLRSVAPAIVPISLIAVFKGYFQGFQDMVPSSSAQALEQVVRVGAMMWFVFVLRDQGLERAVSGAVQGTVIGAMTALAFLVALYARRQARLSGQARARPAGRLRLPPGPGETAGAVLAVAVPVTVGAAVLPVMDAVQTFLVPGRLQAAGVDPGVVTHLYGQLHGMAYPLVGLPAIVAAALAAALVPAIADAVERGARAEAEARISASLRLTVIFSLPATAGLVILARPINQMLFGIPEAGVPLIYVSGACLLISVQQTTTGVLQGLGFVRVPLYGLLAGLGANAVTTYFLAAMPALGINGAALGIVAGFLVASSVNLAAVFATTRMRFDVPGLVFRPAVATAAMSVATAVIYRWLMGACVGNVAATVLAVVFGASSYLISLVAVGGLSSRELRLIPVLGPKLAGLFRWGGPR